MAGNGAQASLLGGMFILKGAHLSFTPSFQDGDIYAGMNSIRLILPDRWLTVEGVRFEDRRPGDLVIVCLDQHETARLSGDDLLPLLASPSGAVIFADGTTPAARKAADSLPEGTPVSFILSLFQAVSLQPGEAELSSRNSWILVERKSPYRRMFSNLRDLGIKTQAVEDISACTNSGIIYRLLELPAAMCNVPLSHFLSCREGRELAIRVLKEGFKTFGKSGHMLGKLPVMDPRELLASLEKKPDKFSEARYLPDRSYGGILQSLLRRRETDAGELNGRIVVMGKDAGVDTSWNWRLLQKLPRVQRNGFYPNPSELLKGI